MKEGKHRGKIGNEDKRGNKGKAGGIREEGKKGKEGKHREKVGEIKRTGEKGR